VFHDPPKCFRCFVRQPTILSFFGEIFKRWVLEQNRDRLAPNAIYRAKIWGRLEHNYQLDFVDAGFMPLIEAEAGQKLTGLIERVVSETKHSLGWKNVSETDGRWLLQSTFWLLAAKILQDKSVRGFIGLDLTKPSQFIWFQSGMKPRPITTLYPQLIMIRQTSKHQWRAEWADGRNVEFHDCLLRNHCDGSSSRIEWLV